MDINERLEELNKSKRMGPFRRALLRGLGVLLPPLLTILVLLWVGHTVSEYLLVPLENWTQSIAVHYFAEIRTPDDTDGNAKNADTVVIEGKTLPVSSKGTTKLGDQVYHRTEDGKFVPLYVYQAVHDGVGREPMPTAATDVWRWYAENHWLQRRFIVPIFICVFLLALYLLGKSLAAGFGRFFWNQFERGIHRVPLVSNVYSSIKQVTDFLFSEPEMQYTRVVAVEYPRRGIWTLGFVTGEPMFDIQCTTEETLMSVFVPHSPMPFTGFAVTVKKSETIDLNISVDQAIQWVVSCGVVIPPPPVQSGILTDAPRRGERLQLSGASRHDG